MLKSIKNFFGVNLSKKTYSLLLLIPLIIFLIIFGVYPFVSTFIESFKVNQANSAVRFDVGIGNFETIATDESFIAAIRNTTLLIFVATPLAMLFGFLVALILNSIRVKFFMNTWISIFYSQFFVSSFAIGIAFILLFGEANVFNRIFNSDVRFFTGDNTSPIFYYYLIFQIWRALPFNLVLFTFAFDRAESKYGRLAKLDKLRWYDRLLFYWHSLKHSFFNIAYTNMIFAALLYPGAIVSSDFNLDTNNAHTLTSYLFQFLDPSTSNNYITIQLRLASATAIIFVAYICLTIGTPYLTYLSIKYKWWRVIKHIKNKFNHSKKENHVLKNK